MNSATVDVIDSSQMQVLTEFAAAGFVHENRDRFRIGSLGTDIIIASHSLAGTWRGSMLFERANMAAVTNLIGEVLHGRLREEARDFVGFQAGKDRIGVSAQMPRDVLTMSLYNNRPANMNGLDNPGWNITVAPDTMLSIYVELKELMKRGIK